MSNRIHDVPMTRRNLHLLDKQYQRMSLIAKKLGVTVAEAYRQAGDMYIEHAVAKLREEKK